MKKNNSKMHASITINLPTTPAAKNLAIALSKRVGSCVRNSQTEKDGVGYSVSHGYNAALLIAAEQFGMADLTEQSDFYKQYKSKG